MFAKNIVVKMHVFLMIFCVAFYQPTAYALSGNPLNFTSIANGAKNAAGFVGDYFFKDYAGTTYSAKGHVVSNSQLAQVAKKRILCVTPVSGLVCAAMFAYGASQVADYLQTEGWIIDKENQKIYKETSRSNEAFCNDLKNYHFPNRNITCSYETTKVNASSTTYTAYVETIETNGSKTGRGYFSVTVQNTLSEREITDTELEAAVAAQPLNVLTGLATSPDFVKEGHAPTAAAAAAAKNDKPAACPAGTVRDPIRGTCLGSDNETKPKENGNTELPEFCSYAQAVCDWINWTKEDPELTPVPEIPKREISRDELPTAQQINFGGGCPAGETFQAFGQTVTLSYGVACDLMTMIKPFVILAGNVTALFIFINSIRN